MKPSDALLVDEILAKGRVVPGQPHARIVSDLGLESYDNPPDRSLVPVPVPVGPQPLATGAFLQVRAGETITGTRQQLWQRFQPADLLRPVLFSGDAVTWGGVNWRCDRAVLNEQGEDVITLRRLS